MVIAAVVMTIAAGRALAQIPQPWPQAFHDAQRTSRAPVRGPAALALQGDFTLPQVALSSGPVVARIGRLFATVSYCIFSTPDGCFAFFSTLISATPSGQWYFVPKDLSVQYGGTPALGDDGTIYIASSLGLRALYPDGRVKWTFPISGSSPVLTGNGLILITTGARLYALDLQGNLQWSKALPPGNSPFTDLAIAADGSIYYGAVSFFVVALDSAGNFKWRYPTVYQMHSPPSVGPDGTVYATGDQLYAIRPDGTLKWTFGSSGVASTGSTAAIGSDGTVYIGGLGRFVALNPDGTEKWSHAGPDPGRFSLLDSEGSVYFFDGSGIRAVRSSGTLKWRRPTDQFTLNFATQFALTLDGTLIAMLGPWITAIGPSAVVP